MGIEQWLGQFPDSEEVFTLSDIAEILQVPYGEVCRAQRTLTGRQSTSAKVQPLDDQTPQHFTPLAARIITRHVKRPTTRSLELRAMK